MLGYPELNKMHFEIKNRSSCPVVPLGSEALVLSFGVIKLLLLLADVHRTRPKITLGV